MAFGPTGSLCLLSAMMAMAALHIARLQSDPDRGRERAVAHYTIAVGNMFAADVNVLDDAVLATALILAHYEVHSGDVVTNGSYGMGK